MPYNFPLESGSPGALRSQIAKNTKNERFNLVRCKACGLAMAVPTELTGLIGLAGLARLTVGSPCSLWGLVTKNLIWGRSKFPYIFPSKVAHLGHFGAKLKKTRKTRKSLIALTLAPAHRAHRANRARQTQTGSLCSSGALGLCGSKT